MAQYVQYASSVDEPGENVANDIHLYVVRIEFHCKTLCTFLFTLLRTMS
jgi:hypothetical protein